MTRGIMTVYNKGKFASKAYINSDAYPEGECAIGFYKAFEQGFYHALDYVNALASEDEESEDIERCWYVKPSIKEGRKLGYIYPKEGINEPYETVTSSDGKEMDMKVFFAEYGYEYDVEADTLTVYHYGKKYFTVARDNIGRLIVLMDNYYEKMCNALGLDTDTMRFTGKRNYGSYVQQIINNESVDVAVMMKKIESVSKKYKWCIQNEIITGYVPEQHYVKVMSTDTNDSRFKMLYFMHDNADKCAYFVKSEPENIMPERTDRALKFRGGISIDKLKKILAHACRSSQGVFDSLWDSVCNGKSDGIIEAVLREMPGS